MLMQPKQEKSNVGHHWAENLEQLLSVGLQFSWILLPDASLIQP
jgi:hypothetical protein